jgi:dUTP pyrophosphatase
MSVEIPVVLSEGSRLPVYQTPGAAGVDLCISESVTLKPLQRASVGTGLRMAIPAGYEGQVRPRSGLASKYGLSMVNAPGTIDSDYRGEIKIILINLGEDVVQLKIGERVGQLVICPVARALFTACETLGETIRGEGGFGSTG